ncbi:MAG: pyruvate dehydrogenase (acetyl-transferring), homodimeric type [Deltaproteobacteria bacterium]|nr:pyruvate dehydrogenase (acetyl-transferring), homodimeric type [Deltaproteobacteria bacterium]
MKQRRRRLSEYAPEELEDLEREEWLDSLDSVVAESGEARGSSLIEALHKHAEMMGVRVPSTVTTPYINTIPKEAEPEFPGDFALERRITRMIRWNAMAMVVRANRLASGIGGHISTYTSAAVLYEVAFNHFLRGRDHSCGGDLVFFQGHASPGIYARAFLEGRISERQLENFRRELADGGGLSSYPHPWLMPNFWEVPTVSMGLGPIMAIYQARFKHYLQDRGLKPPDDSKVWCFLGDGEMDEPESLGAITLAAREQLDNLIFVINCNLQRLDGPVRGNGKIIQELEAAFRGAGWNVIKVIWGRRWDKLLEKDTGGLLVKRMGEVVDGEYQRYKATGPQCVREDFFGAYPELAEMVRDMTDEEIWKLNRGGLDTFKVFSAYKAATEHRGAPTVILAKTIKGYGMGEAGEGKNITHQQKKLNEEELRAFRDRFDIPINDEKIADAPFYRPADDSEEIRYLRERRKILGGYLPSRRVTASALPPLPDAAFTEFQHGSDGRNVATTMALVRVMTKLIRDPQLGKYIVPIIPDEARTFGMESLFREIGIYSHVGQLYEPVDAESLLYYREAKEGQLLEEGITEAGSMSSFIAAGTAYANHAVPTIPFFLFYSMFGFQRIGDLIWAAADMRCRGFLVGATAGRTTLAGEGLQHQDGQSQLLAYPVPTLRAYDPAFAYEIAVIVHDGIRRMYYDGEECFYYLTVENEPYPQPAMPDGVHDGIVRGLYRFRPSPLKKPVAQAQLLGSGAIMNEVIQAATLLESYGVAADLWSVTSYKALHQNALDVDRWNLLHPAEPASTPYVTECLGKTEGVVVAASDYVKALPESIARWSGRPWVSLGTDGFGRSETRNALRDFFEVDARHIAFATLSALAREGAIPIKIVEQAAKKLAIDPHRTNPITM